MADPLEARPTGRAARGHAAVAEHVRPQHAAGDRRGRRRPRAVDPWRRATDPSTAANGIAGEAIASALPPTQGEPTATAPGKLAGRRARSDEGGPGPPAPGEIAPDDGRDHDDPDEHVGGPELAGWTRKSPEGQIPATEAARAARGSPGVPRQGRRGRGQQPARRQHRQAEDDEHARQQRRWVATWRRDKCPGREGESEQQRLAIETTPPTSRTPIRAVGPAPVAPPSRTRTGRDPNGRRGPRRSRSAPLRRPPDPAREVVAEQQGRLGRVERRSAARAAR